MSARGAGKTIVDEGNAVADEDFILQHHTLANEAVARYLAAIPNARPFLDFHKRTDLHVIPNLATVKIREREDLHPLAQFYIRSDALVK